MRNIHIDMNLTESRLHNIIIESINNLLLTESQESKSISAAKKLAMQRLGYDEQKADEFVRITLRQEIPSLRTPEGGKFILGVTRMFCDRQLTDANIFSRLNATLKYVASDAHINEYDRNLNGISAKDLIDRFAKNVEMDLENDKAKIKQNQYTGVSEYDIVRIDSFEQAKEYYKYTFPESRWCLTHIENQFEAYTCGGANQIYFCLKKGFENIEPIPSEGCPLDEYGLSMLSVIVNENGALVHCTNRWNHSYGGNDNVMNTEQISKVVNIDFYEAFKPNNTWNEKLADVMQRLANGERPEDVFDYCEYDSNGFAWVSLCEKENLIKPNGELLSPNQWFDEFNLFSEGFAKVWLNDKVNYINKNGEIIYKPNELDQWFEFAWDFENGFGIVVHPNGKKNFIDRNGNILYKPDEPDQWFDYCFDFVKGLAKVELNGKLYQIDKNGNFVGNQPQVTESLIRNVNELNYNRNMKQRIRLTESDLHSIIKESVNRILNESDDVKRQWESEKRAFLRGLKDGKAYVDGDTVYVEIGRHNERDPRYVYFRLGGNKLMDDHFYVQSSPKLSKRAVDNIYRILNFVYGVDVSEYMDELV